MDALEQFAEQLLTQPEALQGRLPAMPPDEIQISWTGDTGRPLMAQTLAFVRAIEAHMGTRLTGAKILDYGCGWGRHLRLMMHYTDQLYGVDAWDRSIDLCRQYGVPGTLAVTDYVPREPFFPDARFDLAYAYSVFTHLSERTALAVMRAIRGNIAPTGLAVITIRDRQYWDAHAMSQHPIDRATMKAAHDHRGFAFVPHLRELVDGEVPYGDTSMTIEYIRTHWNEWRVERDAVFAGDPLQRLVFLRPA